jgi:hypothetical protein
MFDLAEFLNVTFLHRKLKTLLLTVFGKQTICLTVHPLSHLKQLFINRLTKNNWHVTLRK